MERNYPGTGFGDLGAGTGWSYERSAKASLVYGSSRSSHPNSELLHRQAYGTPHPLQGYATNHHPGSSGQGGAWGAGRSLGLSGLFDTGLHHASPSGPDPSVMNLISALESQGRQPPPSASSLLSQFRTPSWQTAMHTQPELFIGSGSFPSSSISAYQHPASFSGRSFPGASLSLQDSPTFSPTSNGLLSPHDPLLHIKTPSQSSLGFDRLLSSQGAAYRGSQDPTGPPQTSSSSSSGRHLPPPQFNLLSSQLQDQSSQLYNASVFSSAPAPPPPQPPQERAIPRQDSVIKHYQRSSPAQSQLSSSAPHPLQHYLSCGASGYQQISHHRHGGVSCSPLGEQSPSADPKPSPRSDQVYRPIIQTPYTSSAASSSGSGGGLGKGAKNSSSSSGYSSSGSSSSRTPHTPPSASSSSSNSNPNPSSSSSSAPSRQQPPTQSAPPPPPPPPVSSAPAQQPPPKPCLSAYGSPVAPVKPTAGLPGQTPPQQQSYSPSQPPPSHLPSHQPYGGFSSPQAQDLTSGPGSSGKGYGGLGPGGRSFSAEVVYGTDSGYSSLPTSLGGAGSPSLGYGGPRHSPALLGSGGGGGSAGSGAGSGAGGGGSGGGGAGSGGSSGAGGGSSYHLPDSSPSPSSNSGIIRPGLHSPAPARPAQSPGGAGGNKYLSSVLSPAFLSSPQGYPDTRGPQSQSYHPTPPKPKPDADMLGVERSQDEEDDDDDDFLIQHLLHAQSPAPHPSQHHPQQQPPQSIPQARDGGKGLAYDLSKASEERYHLQSVIRTNSATNSTVPGTAGNVSGGGLESQLEMSLKKQQQQAKNERGLSGAGAGGGRGGADSLSHPNPHVPYPQQHDSLGSVVHYGRSDPYSQHPHTQHPHHPSQAPSHPQHTQHSRHAHPHSHGHPHMELKKPPDSSELPYLRKTPELQQQPRQSQPSLSLMDSPPNQPQQPPSAHMLQSVLSHTTRNKMDTQQAASQQQQHSMSQQAMMGAGGEAEPGGQAGVDPQPQSQSQLQLQLQSQAMEAHYGQASQNSVSPLDMLERTLSRANSRDSGGAVERSGVGGGDGGSGDGHRQQQQQHRLPSHHHSQQTASKLHDFLSEPDLGITTPSHLHHLNPHHPHVHHQQQTHPHHPLPHTHAHPHSHHLATNAGTQQQQPPPHQRDQEPQLCQSQLDQLKEHQFDTVSPVGKAGQSQGQQQQQRFVPLTSICFPDSLLQDEDRSFFPGMEDMFCSDDYSKSSCAGGPGAGQGVQEGMSEARGQGPDSMEDVKTSDGGGGYDMMGHHGDQGYGYCHSLTETENSTMHLDLDSLKTHELPSTVNTEQLGLIQSQTPGLGLGVPGGVPGDGSANKMIGGTGVGGGSGLAGLTSPIFCSSRPKKLLKTSSFHLLKQRRDPQPQAKKNYAQEYEFEDDEDKADVPADIRLNSRRLPDLLPDLVSSCRKAGGGGASGVGSLSPLMGDLDFCHPSGYPSLGPPPQLLPHDGPKKRGRKPTKPKREGPPRPRGRPRIRPLPEPPYCRGLMGNVGGETRRGRGRGRGRGRKEEGMIEMHREMNKQQNIQPQQQQQQQHLQHLHQQHPQHQKPFKPIKIKLPIPSMSPSDSLLRTDSLSSTDPVLSDGSVGSAPSLGLSPGTTAGMDMNITRSQEKMKQKAQTEDKPPELKSNFMASFLDFLKTGKKQPESGPGGPQDLGGPVEGAETTDSSSLKGRILSPPPPPPPPPPPFGDSSEGEDGLSPCKRLDDELKRNLETLPSFSSDEEEDSVSKNQDLQKSISSAISALYDTPHSLAAAVAPLPPSPSPPQSPSLPPTPPPVAQMQEDDDEEEQQEPSLQQTHNPSASPPPSSSPPALPSPPSPSPAMPPSTTPPPSSSPPLSDAPELAQPSSSPSSSPPSPPTPEDAPAPKITSLHLAKKQDNAAIAGESEEEDSESGGEGIFRERDEFVVRTEDIGTLKMALQTGREPPPIWRVQKALLQKFSPEIKDGQRQFCATSNYLGYFGDAKMRYQRLYVKFLENFNKKDYVRVCSRKPWHRPGLMLRRQSLPSLPKPPPPAISQTPPRLERDERERKEKEKEQKEKEQKEKEKEQKERKQKEKEKEQKERKEREKEKQREKEREEKEKRRPPPQEKVERRSSEEDRKRLREEKRGGGGEKKTERPSRARPVKAEPPPKKRKKWLKEVPSDSDSSPDGPSEDQGEGLSPVRGGMNSRAMREMFRSYIEMLVSTALDPDMIQALEDTDDELYLPPMRKIDSLLNEQKRRLLRRVNMSGQHQETLHMFPKMTADPLDSGAVKVHVGGECYNRKTLNRVKKSTTPKQQDLKLSTETCRVYSLYHSLHHYKYHTFLNCKKETDSIEQAAEDPGQEEVVQQCMANQGWLETLFNSFIDLLTLSTKA
uniref:Proline rich 12 n=1 Tax=Salmo trutta TaxID=8032 RepID=A0A674A5D2_SALTR